MARSKKAGSDLSLSGTRLSTRFALTMSIAVAIVMLIAGAFLYTRILSAAARVQEQAFVEAVRTQAPLLTQLRAEQDAEIKERVLGIKSELPPRAAFAQPVQGSSVETFGEDGVVRRDVMYGPNLATRGYLYQFQDVQPPLLVPLTVRSSAGEGLLGLILGVTLVVILVVALVAWMVGGAVARPLELIVDDIAQISRGDLRHRTRVRAGGEIMLLAKSIDRMAGNLESAKDAQLELSVRDREIGLASEVREALLPDTTPTIPGYDLGSLHVDSPTPGGDFHDFIELPGGRIGLLVCDVSGRGIPGAMIGAIARSYLRVELARDGDLGAALARVNGALARDVRRGMFVSALFASVDPVEGIATVACAGHKMPLIRFAASEKRIRLVQPEGIALGLDKGPVFARTLQVLKVPLERGDRIVIANTGPVQVRNPAGEELGEKAFYRSVLQHAGLDTASMLAKVEEGLRHYAGGAAFPNDISIVSLSRRA